ncbi:MAG: hypothetical protein AAF228_05290 [Pseudomonadota bacterium]
MNPVAVITLAGVIMLLSALLGSIIAWTKNRSADSWGFFCFLFPPMLIILLFLSKSSKSTHRKITKDDLDEELKEWID